MTDNYRVLSVAFVDIIACTIVYLEVAVWTCVELSVVLVTILDLTMYSCMVSFVNNKRTKISDVLSFISHTHTDN